MNELDKMQAGEFYDFSSPEIVASNRRARRALERFNRAAADDETGRRAALEELIPGIPESSTIIPPFFCDHGHPIRIGENTFVNAGATMLDSGGITIGARTKIGPDCKLYTPQHPMDYRERRKPIERGLRIEIGDDLLAGRQRNGVSGREDRRPLHRRCGQRRGARHPRRLAGGRQPGDGKTQTAMNMIHTTKYLGTLLAGALMLSTVSCDEGDEFYTENYSIVAVDAIVEATAQTPGEGEEAAEDPRLEQIRAEVMAASPVEAGGNYTLHFTEYDGGPLDIVTTAGAAPLAGAFRKVPGSTTLEFIYDEEARIYALESYRAEDQRMKVVLQLDLTARYRTLYPDAGITRAIRREYTSHNY